MRVGITGHLSGLGKELYTRIPNSVGFDIGTSRNKQIVNFDIRKPDPWIDELYKCDVFINNAYDGFHQVDMLGKVFMMWKEEDKLIINISSIAPEDRKNINYQITIHNFFLCLFQAPKSPFDHVFDIIIPPACAIKGIGIRH